MQKYSLFHLLRLALGSEEALTNVSSLKKEDWKALIDLSFEQGVAAISVDGLQKLYEANSRIECEIDNEELEDLKYEWFGACFENEQSYDEHLKVIEKLAALYGEQSIKMLLLKGYGLSLNYPIPEHRTSGDIDIFLYDSGEAGDSFVSKYFGCNVNQSKVKHSVFTLDGIMVENHACFINDTLHPIYRALNEYLIPEADKGKVHKIGKTQILIPSAMFNALFIPAHIAGHFVHGEATVRQLCDWACFVHRYGTEVDWNFVRELSIKCGFWKFCCYLNGIVQEYLGVPKECLPDWPLDKKMEGRILEEILAPRKVATSLIGKSLRFFLSRWKYVMVYNDSMLETFFKLVKFTILPKSGNSESLWEKQ